MPVWGVWLDRAFWFSTHPDSRKGRNLTANPNVVVHLESGDEVAIVEGRAEPPADAARERIVLPYEEKYGIHIDVAHRGPSILTVRPRIVFAWREADFPDSATRWRFDAE
jgi:hypothetical protein